MDSVCGMARVEGSEVTAAEKQRTDALALANHVRIASARFKEDIAGRSETEGRRLVAEFLANPITGPTGHLKINRLILAIDRVGDQQLRLILRYAGVHNPEKHVRNLTDRQRMALAEVIEDKQILYPGSRIAA